MRPPTEIRNCKICDKEYGWYRTNRYGYCASCRKKEYLKRNRMSDDELKKSYPLNQNEKQKRYRKIRKDLNKAYTREEWRQIFNRELEYMEASGIMLWCIDRRNTKEDIKEPGSGRTGRKPLGVTDMRIKHPDTRNMPE